MIEKGWKTLLILSILGAVFVFWNAGTVNAQSGSSVSVDYIYETNGNITFTLSSYSENLDAVTITWLVGGKSVLSGIGKKVFSLSPTSTGSSSLVVKIDLPTGEIQKNINMVQSESMLLWEATDSYVPPFYKGKALPSKGGSVKVTAIPEIRSGGTVLDPKSLIYNWRKDYENEGSASGYGKNYFRYINDFFDASNTIDVTVNTVSGESSKTDMVNVPFFTPEISFYRKDPQLGTIWSKSIDNGSLVTNGEILTAAPYFISPKDIRRPDLVFSWFINGNPLNLPNFRKNSLPLAVPEGVSGSSNLRLEIENTNNVFQEVLQEVELIF